MESTDGMATGWTFATLWYGCGCRYWARISGQGFDEYPPSLPGAAAVGRAGCLRQHHERAGRLASTRSSLIGTRAAGIGDAVTALTSVMSGPTAPEIQLSAALFRSRPLCSRLKKSSADGD